MSIENIEPSPSAVTASCCKDFVSFLELLCALPSVDDYDIECLLLTRKFMLWVQSVFNCIFRGLNNFFWICKEYQDFKLSQPDAIDELKDDLDISVIFRDLITPVAANFVESIVSGSKKKRGKDLIDKNITITFDKINFLNMSGK